MKRFVSIGECMIELSGAEDDLWRMGIAGDTLNTAWYARACLPADWAVAYGTCIGANEISSRVPAFLAENGIETDRIFTHPSRSIGLYVISLQDGERSFSYWRDTSAARTLADDPDRLVAMTAEAQVIHVSGITLAILPPAGRETLLDVLRQRRREGATIAFDPNLRPALWEDLPTAADTMKDAARVASVVLPSFDDEVLAFGDRTPDDTIDRYAGLGAEIVAVKNGGSKMHIFKDGDRQVFHPPARLDPVDTTGAGDSFNGAFLAALACGASLQNALASGHRVARSVVNRHGALMPMDLVREIQAADTASQN
tara:strand:- start:6331 stop:7269 length:939 start_codon:yes stop_codon:yes gene_type:complete